MPNLKRVISDLNRRKQRGFEQKQAKETKAWRRERASQPGLADELKRRHERNHRGIEEDLNRRKQR